MMGIFKKPEPQKMTPKIARDQVITREKARQREVIASSNEGSARIERLLKAMRGELDGEYNGSHKPIR